MANCASKPFLELREGKKTLLYKSTFVLWTWQIRGGHRNPYQMGREEPKLKNQPQSWVLNVDSGHDSLNKNWVGGGRKTQGILQNILFPCGKLEPGQLEGPGLALSLELAEREVLYWWGWSQEKQKD